MLCDVCNCYNVEKNLFSVMIKLVSVVKLKLDLFIIYNCLIIGIMLNVCVFL